MSQQPKQGSRFLNAVRHGTPPFLTVLASAAMLSGAIWVRHHEHAAGPVSLGATGNTILSATPQQDPAGHIVPQVPTANSTGNDAGSNESPANETNKPSPPETAQDIGFAPVSGGTKAMAPSAPLTGGSQASCVVTQYGQSPQTSFNGHALMAPDGTEMVLPPAAKNNFLALPLSSGVLWASVPGTTMDPVGKPDTSVSPTALYYTPYPASGGDHALTSHVVLLGQLPISVAGSEDALTPSWYHPALILAPKRSQTGTANADGTDANTFTNTTSNNPPTDTGNTTASANDTSTGSTGGTTFANPNVIQQLGPYRLFLQGFYQTSTGAVIAISVNNTSAGTNDTWLYLWNVQSQTLTPVVQLQNGHNSFSWFAVGQDVIYWESRHAIPPQDIHYQGEQNVLNVHTLARTHIHLGTWSTQAVAVGNSLQFELGQSVQWNTFTPDPAIASPVH